MNIASSQPGSPPLSGRPKVALIAGPTASGKSALALALAQRHGGTIINADSAQVYRDLRVLTARPDASDEALVPHRLFGEIDGARAWSAADWAASARIAITDTVAAGRLPILVGGTGLYLRTLLDGIAPVPAIDPAIRAAVRTLPVADAHAALAQADPAAAARLAPADSARIARALEVVRATGHPLAYWQAHAEGGIGERIALAPLILFPDRDWLGERIDRRIAAMIDGGALDEVAALVARADLPADAPVRRAIGVPELAACLDGRLSRTAAAAALSLATRRYAKRQLTWFRNQPPADWPRSDASDPTGELAIFETLLR